MNKLIKLGVANVWMVIACHADGASLATPPLLSLGLDPYISSSLRSGLNVDLIHYPSAQYALGVGFAAGLTTLHRETIYEAVFLVNHLRGAPVHGFNLKLTGGVRSFNHEEVSRDIGISYAIPIASALVWRFGVMQRRAHAGSKEQAFLYKEKRRADATDILLSVELMTGRLDR